MIKRLVFALLLVSAFSVHAGEAAKDKSSEKIDWKSCEKELKEFGCKGSDKELWTCLEKHDGKLSEACEEVHEAADERFED
jgi:hypothetical protein